VTAYIVQDAGLGWPAGWWCVHKSTQGVWGFKNALSIKLFQNKNYSPTL